MYVVLFSCFFDGFYVVVCNIVYYCITLELRSPWSYISFVVFKNKYLMVRVPVVQSKSKELAMALRMWEAK